jgi:Fe-S-cluster containining protein
MADDAALIQIVDAALAEAARKAGPWLACRPGCCECCIGPFAITPLDTERLRRGFDELTRSDPDRAARVGERARESVARLTREYPGETLARVLEEDDGGGNEPCPALNPETGTCDLYAYRPITCRMFGPPVRFDGQSLAVCELCFDGATAEEVAACAVDVDARGMEPELLAELDGQGDTIVAFALAGRRPAPLTLSHREPRRSAAGLPLDVAADAGALGG